VFQDENRLIIFPVTVYGCEIRSLALSGQPVSGLRTCFEGVFGHQLDKIARGENEFRARMPSSGM
jgi:hypothetical protein